VAEGGGPPGALLVADTLVVAIELVAEPSDAVPMDASESDARTEDISGEMYTPAERERSTTVTATEILQTARMQTRMTNQWRRQKEAERVGLRCGGTGSEVNDWGYDRD
jgi:HAMP domain-containing protein